MHEGNGDAARGSWFADAARDVRVGSRSLARRPGFTAVAVLTLAVGIGACVAMFGVLDAALLRTLPFSAPDRLVVGRTLWPDGTVGLTVSAPDYYDVREEASSLEATGALTPFTVEATLTGDGEPERLGLRFVSPGFFRLLGTPPVLGREFRTDEGEPGAEPTVLLGYSIWQRRYAGDPDILGATLDIDGSPATVVGILPAGFSFFGTADLWAPMVRGGPFASGRQFHNWLVVGRLRDGVTVPGVRSEVDVLMARLADAHPESNRDKGMVITPLAEALVERYRSSLLLLGGAVLSVLLIACANVASLLLARGTGRHGEVAVRTALGAGRGRLVRQLVAESALIGAAAGALGTAVAFALQRAILGIAPMPPGAPIDAPVRLSLLGFALAATAVTVLLAGLAPAIATTRARPATSLRSDARGATASRTWFRSGLVVAQVAISLLLLSGAGLLARSFIALSRVDPGFLARSLITADVSLGTGAYPEPERRIQFFRTLAERARAIPGVEAVGLISRLPIRDGGGNVAVWDPAHPPTDASEWRLAYLRTVLPGYFDAMQIPLRRGRDFGSTDADGAPAVMIVSETLGRTLFPGEDPVGRVVAIDAGDRAPRFEVVGIVGDVRVSGVTDPLTMTAYFPHAQRPAAGMRIAVRYAGPSVAAPLRDLVHDLDPDVPLAGLRTMDDILADAVAFPRTVTLALAAFAAVALLLAALGLYGVLAFQVAQRRREIGIRIALGARRSVVLSDVVRRGLTLVGLGAAFGIPATLLGGRLLADQLYETSTRDPVTLGAVIALLVAATLAACVIPAWRALRVDPAMALRSE